MPAKDRSPKIQTYGRKVAERIYSTREVAAALGVSRMTLQRRINDGLIVRPKMFLQRRSDRVWVWDAREFSRILGNWRAGKRKW